MWRFIKKLIISHYKTKMIFVFVGVLVTHFLDGISQPIEAARNHLPVAMVENADRFNEQNQKIDFSQRPTFRHSYLARITPGPENSIIYIFSALHSSNDDPWKVKAHRSDLLKEQCATRATTFAAGGTIYYEFMGNDGLAFDKEKIDKNDCLAANNNLAYHNLPGAMFLNSGRDVMSYSGPCHSTTVLTDEFCEIENTVAKTFYAVKPWGNVFRK